MEIEGEYKLDIFKILTINVYEMFVFMWHDDIGEMLLYETYLQNMDWDIGIGLKFWKYWCEEKRDEKLGW